MASLSMKAPTMSKIDPARLKALAVKSKAAEKPASKGNFIDPNYPGFKTALDERVLIYVPNVLDEDGSFVHSRASIHSLNTIAGKYAGSARCIAGFEDEELGYKGECPLCETEGAGWDYYNAQKEHAALRAGIEVDSDKAKDLARPFLSHRPVDRSEEFITFPILLIKTNPGSITPATDSEGNLDVELQWYSIKGKRYDEVWGKSIAANLDEDDESGERLFAPGKFLMLDFRVAGGEEANLRNSGQALKVNIRPNLSAKADKDMVAALTKATDEKAREDWGPERVITTLENHGFLGFAALEEFATETQQELAEKIAAVKSQPTSSTNPLDGVLGGGNDSVGLTNAVAVPDSAVDEDEPEV